MGMVRAAAMLVALTQFACSPAAPPADPGPPGALLVARTRDLGRVLERLARMRGTPLGIEAARLAAALPACPVVEARASDGELASLFAALVCAPQPSALAALHAELGDATAVFAWPLAAGPRLRGRFSFDASEDAEIEIFVPHGSARGPAALLVPGDATPGPGVLSGSESLLHARLRPAGGLDLAALVPDGGQADRMFRLKSELFAGAVLDGTWEAAVYLPSEGTSMPRAALALGFRARGPAVAAAESFLAELRKTWPLSRRDYRSGESAGACLPDLRILPEFAPCYVATDSALVVGWNPASIDKALDGEATLLGADGGLLVNFERFPEADVRMARALGAPPTTPWPGPWSLLRAAGRERADGVQVRVHLEAGDGA